MPRRRANDASRLRHHERLGALAGLSGEEIGRVREGAGAAGWTPRQALLLRAADELLAPARSISDDLWVGLERR